MKNQISKLKNLIFKTLISLRLQTCTRIEYSASSIKINTCIPNQFLTKNRAQKYHMFSANNPEVIKTA